MAALLPGGGWGFWLPMSVLPTKHPGWAKAGVRLQRRALDEAAKIASKRWDVSRARGLDRKGEPLTPIAAATRKARRADINPVTGNPPYSPMGRAQPAAPPLTPVRGSSRTRSYLRWKAVPGRGVWFHWRYDFHMRYYWGAILARHAAGFTQRFQSGFRYVPARDVRGFSPAELADVAHIMEQWGERNLPKPPPRARVTRDVIELIVPRRQPLEEQVEELTAKQRRQLRLLAASEAGAGVVEGRAERAVRAGTTTGLRQLGRVPLKKPPGRISVEDILRGMRRKR